MSLDPQAGTVSETGSTDGKKPENSQITGLPTIQYYMKTYGKSCGSNDRKGARLFQDYESGDKVNRLKRELAMVAQSKVTDDICARFIGNQKKATYETFARWAGFMLSSLNAAR